MARLGLAAERPPYRVRRAPCNVGHACREALMTERPIPPDFMWPSKAAEKFRFLLFSDRTIPWGEPGSKGQYQEARTQLLQALATGRIRASFICKTSGKLRTLPSRFWYTDSQDNAWHGDFRLLSDVPLPQNWQFDDSPAFYGTYGYALVEEASLQAFFEEPSEPVFSVPLPEQGEKKTSYVLRALGLKVARPILKPETLPIAEAWLRTRKLPCEKRDVDAEVRRMQAGINHLVRRIEG